LMKRFPESEKGPNGCSIARAIIRRSRHFWLGDSVGRPGQLVVFRALKLTATTVRPQTREAKQMARLIKPFFAAKQQWINGPDELRETEPAIYAKGFCFPRGSTAQRLTRCGWRFFLVLVSVNSVRAWKVSLVLGMMGINPRGASLEGFPRWLITSSATSFELTEHTVITKDMLFLTKLSLLGNSGHFRAIVSPFCTLTGQPSRLARFGPNRHRPN
jgi:hypothetical protein